MQETSLTEPTELRNQSWDKRRRTIRKCQVVLHWNLSRLSPCDCCLQGHWHFSALRWLHTSGHTLNVHSHLSAKRLADKIGRDKSTFISVCERQPCPAGVARSLVQIPPAWRKESRALPGSDLGGGGSRAEAGSQRVCGAGYHSEEELRSWGERRGPLACPDPETGVSDG